MGEIGAYLGQWRHNATVDECALLQLECANVGQASHGIPWQLECDTGRSDEVLGRVDEYAHGHVGAAPERYLSIGGVVPAAISVMITITMVAKARVSHIRYWHGNRCIGTVACLQHSLDNGYSGIIIARGTNTNSASGQLERDRRLELGHSDRHVAARVQKVELAVAERAGIDGDGIVGEAMAGGDAHVVDAARGQTQSRQASCQLPGAHLCVVSSAGVVDARLVRRLDRHRQTDLREQQSRNVPIDHVGLERRAGPAPAIAVQRQLAVRRDQLDAVAAGRDVLEGEASLVAGLLPNAMTSCRASQSPGTHMRHRHVLRQLHQVLALVRGPGAQRDLELAGVAALDALHQARHRAAERGELEADRHRLERDADLAGGEAVRAGYRVVEGPHHVAARLRVEAERAHHLVAVLVPTRASTATAAAATGVSLVQPGVHAVQHLIAALSQQQDLPVHRRLVLLAGRLNDERDTQLLQLLIHEQAMHIGMAYRWIALIGLHFWVSF